MGNPVRNLTGQRFGHLIVLKFLRVDIQAIWLVECFCKNKIEIMGGRLTNKTRPMTHCGCLSAENYCHAKKGSKFNDLTDRVFGNLTVLKFIRFDNINNAIWLVECFCKNKIEVRGGKLTANKKPMTHCGCLTKKHQSDGNKGKNVTHGQSQTKEYRIEHYHKRKIKILNSLKSIPVYLGSIKESRLKLSYCVYCGLTINLTTDHIVPIFKGGTSDIKNLVTACKSCNCSKNQSFFIDWYLKTTKVTRSLTDIIKDMGFDSIFHLQHYQNSMCPDYYDQNRSMVAAKILKAERKSIKFLDRYYQSLDHYPTH